MLGLEGVVVKKTPCNGGEVGSIPGWGTTRDPYATGQLSPLTTTTEPTRHGQRVTATTRESLPQLGSHCHD